MSNRKEFRTTGYLKVGDVLLLEWGTAVKCAECPRYLDDNASPYAQGKFDTVIQVGVPLSRKNSLETIRTTMSDHIAGIFSYYHIPLTQEDLDHFLLDHVPPESLNSYMVPAGLYEITKIDTFPKGQKISMKTYNPERKEDEYRIYIQQGGFHVTHMDKPKVVVDPERMQSKLQLSQGAAGRTK
jgi:hypothetical protein